MTPYLEAANNSPVNHKTLKDGEMEEAGIPPHQAPERLSRMVVRVTDPRKRRDWAQFMKGLLDGPYARVSSVVLVMDQLNTHSVASFYEAFEPEEARRLSARLDIHYTPKHGSWLNKAEIELSALSRQCLDRRISEKKMMEKQVRAWTKPTEQNKDTRELAIHHQECAYPTTQTLSIN